MSSIYFVFKLYKKKKQTNIKKQYLEKMCKSSDFPRRQGIVNLYPEFDKSYTR